MGRNIKSSRDWKRQQAEHLQQQAQHNTATAKALVEADAKARQQLVALQRDIQAERAEVTASVENGTLHVAVRDDGVGGARLEHSSGLLGLEDRAAAVDGELSVESPPGDGTLVSATLPVPAA